MEKYVAAAGLYLLGIFIYGFYYLVICKQPREMVNYMREYVENQYPDRLIKTLTCIVIVLFSFIWPVSMIFDISHTFRKENKA